MPLVNFYKGSYSTDRLIELCGVAGNIVFDNNTSRIYAGTTGEGSTLAPKVYGSNVIDAVFDDYTLTITKLSGSTVTLDFGDVASASQTMAVFTQLEGIMGGLNSEKTAPDYTSDQTGILHHTGQGETDVATLAAADLALAAAIADRLNGLDSVADADDTAAQAGHATVTVTTPTADFKVLNSVTETDGKLTAADAYQLKKVAATAEAEDLYKTTNSAAVYDTTANEISSSWANVVTSNALADGDTVDTDLNKLDTKIAGLADELIRDERVINAAVNAVVDSVGLEDDFTLDLTGDSTDIIHDDHDVKTALLHLAENITNSMEGLDSEADADDTAAQEGHATVTHVTPTNDFKVLNAVVQRDGKLESATAYDVKKVAATAEAEDLYKTTNSNAVYNTVAAEISSTWVSTVTSNALVDGDSVDTDLNKLDNKIAGIADELINDEQVINETVSAISDSVGLEDDFSLDLTGINIIGNDQDVKSALTSLATTIGNMDSTATIASKSGDTITLKAGLVQTDGVVTNNSSSDITLADVAATGAAADVSITDTTNHYTTDNVDAALNQLASEVSSLQGSFDVIVASNAATTPQGVSWTDNTTTPATTVTGSLVASADTFHKFYLVPGENGSSTNTYREFITTKSTDSQDNVTYGWEKLGDIDVDLTGYVKTITLNGKSYSVASNSTNVTLTDVITAITGETAISGGESTLVAVTATTTKNTTNGTNETVLASSVKIEEVADGLVKDSQPNYQDTGHYVIENGKLVSAVGKTSGDTYTISANDGLVRASDARAYVDSAIQDARMAWAQWS